MFHFGTLNEIQNLENFIQNPILNCFIATMWVSFDKPTPKFIGPPKYQWSKLKKNPPIDNLR